MLSKALTRSTPDREKSNFTNECPVQHNKKPEGQSTISYDYSEEELMASHIWSKTTVEGEKGKILVYLLTDCSRKQNLHGKQKIVTRLNSVLHLCCCWDSHFEKGFNVM
ncbi:hypothetical protein Y1Q_0011303 [Alligator mississippiensis]|uniref:Uncharacterized protein n=1 Tax=Alligator mississippiensis TaxID=8496 RepID=A0A151N838_ALLMI|nr:hypothetical protein Y1Q_0011303 [Alligator mississippiensis]